jgi:hypothetical protein
MAAPAILIPDYLPSITEASQNYRHAAVNLDWFCSRIRQVTDIGRPISHGRIDRARRGCALVDVLVLIVVRSGDADARLVVMSGDLLNESYNATPTFWILDTSSALDNAPARQ